MKLGCMPAAAISRPRCGHSRRSPAQSMMRELLQLLFCCFSFLSFVLLRACVPPHPKWNLQISKFRKF